MVGPAFEECVFVLWMSLLVAGLTSDQILEEMPDLQPEDIEAAVRYARSRIDHPVIAA